MEDNMSSHNEKLVKKEGGFQERASQRPRGRGGNHPQGQAGESWYNKENKGQRT